LHCFLRRFHEDILWQHFTEQYDSRTNRTTTVIAMNISRQIGIPIMIFPAGMTMEFTESPVQLHYMFASCIMVKSIYVLRYDTLNASGILPFCYNFMSTVRLIFGDFRAAEAVDICKFL